MNKKHLIVASAMIMALVLSACSGAAPAAPADTGAVQTAAVATYQAESAALQPATPDYAATGMAFGNPPASQPAPSTPTVVSNRDLPMTVAGADFFALGVEDLGDGWMRIREAGNRDYCAWSNQFKLEVSSGVAIQIPHCLEWRATGTGNFKVTFKPDTIGYDTSDTLSTGLAWWPSGNNGNYRVTRNGQTTAWVPLTTGPEGVNFAKNGGEVTIEFSLENGYMAMPLGEIRNNVQPKY